MREISKILVDRYLSKLNFRKRKKNGEKGRRKGFSINFDFACSLFSETEFNQLSFKG